jgi:hypothetical protein
MNRKQICGLFVLLLLLPINAQTDSPSITHLYVSPTGSDAWSGRPAEANAEHTDGPLQTLTAARDAVRQLKAANTVPGEIRIHLRGGTYFLDRPLELTSEDSGTETAPVMYTAYEGETVRLMGGREVHGFQPVADLDMLNRFKQECRGSILQSDLKAQGITDFGTLVSRGFGRAVAPAGLELFYRDERMTVARWPNTGWAKIAAVPNGPNGGQFTYSEETPGTWAKNDDIWVHGFWTQDWADSYERIKSIDPATKTIETHPPHGIYGYSEGHRYYVLNVPEELDSPGEWYLDRSRGVLYFWPPAPIADGEPPIVSIAESALVLNNCSYITFRGMTLEGTRGTAVRITGGVGNRIAGCTIRHIGNVGAVLSGGKQNGVQSCDIYDTGDGGIGLYGGDKPTLTPAGLFADNNHIHHFNQWCLTYRPAIGIGGVGNRASHNRIHDGPHNAIQLGGNDHLIEYNEIFDVCTESDDVGAFYSGRSWVDRGTVIRYNYFHDIHSAADQYRHGSRVVYLDDAASGFTIQGNLFVKAGSLCAINVGGGRDNRIVNNVFIDCTKGVLIDTRGVGWASDRISEGGEWQMYDKLKAVNFDRPPYSTRYPKLATILEEAPAEPRGNELIGNLALRTPLLDMPESHRHLLTEKSNLELRLEKDGETNIQMINILLRRMPDTEPIPVDKIGLYPDAYRTL